MGEISFLLFSYFHLTQFITSLDIGAELGKFSGEYLLLYTGLFLFGLAFNTLTSWMARHGYVEGYLSLLVALGVLGTLAGMAIIDLEGAILALACFVASGIPMIAGSIIRYMQRREHEQDEIARGGRNG